MASACWTVSSTSIACHPPFAAGDFRRLRCRCYPEPIGGGSLEGLRLTSFEWLGAGGERGAATGFPVGRSRSSTGSRGGGEDASGGPRGSVAKTGRDGCQC